MGDVVAREGRREGRGTSKPWTCGSGACGVPRTPSAAGSASNSSTRSPTTQWCAANGGSPLLSAPADAAAIAQQLIADPNFETTAPVAARIGGRRGRVDRRHPCPRRQGVRDRNDRDQPLDPRAVGTRVAPASLPRRPPARACRLRPWRSRSWRPRSASTKSSQRPHRSSTRSSSTLEAAVTWPRSISARQNCRSGRVEIGEAHMTAHFEHRRGEHSSSRSQNARGSMRRADRAGDMCRTDQRAEVAGSATCGRLSAGFVSGDARRSRWPAPVVVAETNGGSVPSCHRLSSTLVPGRSIGLSKRSSEQQHEADSCGERRDGQIRRQCS